MLVCPVCEHAQDGGDECAVCGRSFPGRRPQEELAHPLADLEPTRLASSPTPEVEALADLEPTLRDAAPDAAVEPAPWIERISVPREGDPLDLLALPVCRYCRTPASPGDVFCSRCGLKLAVHAVERPAPGGDVRRCRFCGASGAGESCPACGARLAGEG